MKTASTILLLGLLQLGVATPALAENVGGTFTLTPFIGGYAFDDEQDLDQRSYYGLRGGYNFTPSMGVELMFGGLRTETDSMLPPDRDVDVQRYAIEGLYHFNTKRSWVPFVALGYGVVKIDNPTPLDDVHAGAFDLGAGLKYFVSDTVALRADVRHSLYRDSFVEEDVTNLDYTVGVTFHFGGPTKVAKRAPDCPVCRQPVAALIVLEDTHFDFDKATLTPRGEIVMDRNIQILKANPNMKVRVAGYTSAAGTREYNQKLSERRATTVRNYLIREGGISGNRLTTIGYGQSRPAQYEPLPENIYSKEAKANMRVIFEVIVK